MTSAPHLTALVAGRMLRCLVPAFAAYWAIMITICACIVTGMALGGVLDISLWNNVGAGAPRYWLLAMAVVNVVNLRIYLAQGITRRQVSAAILVFYAALALIFALITTVGYVVEHQIYQGADLLGSLAEPYPVRGLAGVADAFLSIFLVDLAHLVAGALIGAGYYRYGNTVGTLLIPLGLLPALSTELAVNAHWFGLGVNSGLDLPVAPLPLGALIAVVLVAIGAAAGYRVIRTMPVRAATAR